MMRFDYHRPRSLAEACRLKSAIEGSRFIAGGTDLITRMKSGRERHPALISIRSLPEIRGIWIGGEATIGAATTFTSILEDPALCGRYPVLNQAIRAIGCVQVRNVATIGGNLCNAIPCADSALALIVLDASVSILGPSGARSIPVAQLFLGPRETCLRPDEILTSIVIPAPSPSGGAIFIKKTRVARDLAQASVALFLEMAPDGKTCRKARAAAGAVAPVPMKLAKVEALLEGVQIGPEVIAQAREAARACIKPISDVRASADYRRHVTGVMLGRAIERLLAGGKA